MQPVVLLILNLQYSSAFTFFTSTITLLCNVHFKALLQTAATIGQALLLLLDDKHSTKIMEEKKKERKKKKKPGATATGHRVKTNISASLAAEGAADLASAELTRGSNFTNKLLRESSWGSALASDGIPSK